LSKSTNKISAKAKFKCTIIAKISIIINIDTKNGLYGFCALNRKKKKKTSFSSVKLVKGKEKRSLHTYIPLVATAISLLLDRRASVRNRTQTHFLKNVIQENLATIYPYLALKA